MQRRSTHSLSKIEVLAATEHHTVNMGGHEEAAVNVHPD